MNEYEWFTCAAFDSKQNTLRLQAARPLPLPGPASCNMDLSNLQNRLILVEYPGIVRNPDRMQETLGGINRISDVFCTDKRLPLTFHPDNVYAKPTHGDRTEGSGLLLKVVIRRPKNRVSKQPVETKAVSIVGMVDTVYQFKSESKRW